MFYFKTPNFWPLQIILFRSYAVTQFESESARMAFPGFDEPSYKATYFVQLSHADNMIALSNTPQIAKTSKMIGLLDELLDR